ncbi:hypothetical protein F5Y04DRAFT_260314 [Hypomontagnella monticulosa]|nr:hypothetical protein F5Y04DRAFT_260314 [Hypomontagnella monticulosa]
MLLTSSQVSVIVTSGIVVLCTAALFLSGYAIQQRTVRDLRAAIRPHRVARASPKVYQPDPPEKRTVELDDGTVVEITDAQVEGNSRKAEDNYIIVRPSLPGEKSKYQKQSKQDKKKKSSAKTRVGTQNDEEEAVAEQKPISRAERRRQIKEEIRRLSEGKEPVYYQRRLW